MAFDRHILLRSLSPRIISKLLNTLDRISTVIVGSCWAATILMIIFAIYTLSLASSARRESSMDLSIEPVLPILAHDPIDSHTEQTMMDRMKHRYPDLMFDISNGILKVSSPDGSKFRQWLMALSYIEAISPEYQWSINTLCVGKCKGDLMSATLRAERISFSIPDKDKK